MEKRAIVSRSQCSLVISPNLEAMLEYSEKTRQVKEGGGGVGGPRSVGAAVSPLSRSFSITNRTEGGLPPPPRKSRQSRSLFISKPVEERIREQDENEISDLEPGPSANPYINPVPFFTQESRIEGQRVLPEIREDSDIDIDGSPADLAPRANAISGPSTEEASPPGSPADVRRSHDKDLKQPSSATEASSQPSSPLATFAKVDNLNRLFSRGKTKNKGNNRSSLPSRPSTSSGTERAEISSKLARGIILAARGKLTSASKNGGKSTSPAATEMFQSETPVMDIGRQRSVDDEDFGHRVVGVGPAQPLYLSHAYHSSVSSIAASTASLYSDESNSSSIRPASTYDDHHNPRISISSSIYPSSSHLHHSPTHLSPISPPDRMSSLRNLVGGRRSDSSTTNDSDRESFIDMLSPPPQVSSFQSSGPRDDPRTDSNSRPSTPTAQLRSNSDDSSNAQTSSSNYAMFIKKPRGRSRSPKPPIPTTPKPLFNRPSTPLGISTRLLPSPKPSPIPSPLDIRSNSDELPSTTNLLNPEERAELIRKSQKLAKVFGQPPGAEALNQQCINLQTQSLRQRVQHSRGAASISIGEALAPGKEQSKPAWPPPEATQYFTISGRRRSDPDPSIPDDFPFLKDGSSTGKSGHGRDDVEDRDSQIKDPESDHAIEIGTEEGVPSSDWDRRLHQKSKDQKMRPDSPTSFIDLSDAEEPPSPDDNDDGLSIINNPSTKPGGGEGLGRRRRGQSVTQSLYENMSPEEQAEEGRRRKREKLAKLHRFLGSRVPMNLALGLPGDPTETLPPITFAANPDLDTSKLDSPTMPFPPDEVTRKIWLRRRRSSSAAAIPSSWSDDVDRLKEDLNDREKAINVKRAQKMEKVFGVAPPQTLYHTRHVPSPSLPAGSLHINTLHLSESQPSSPNPKNSNQTSYTRTNPFPYPKSKSKKSDRPGTSESSKALLPTKGGMTTEDSPINPVRRSYVYTHYQHSLNSLNDIIDRDDKESLAELHEYLHSGDDDLNSSSGPSPTALQEFTRSPLPVNRRLSSASIKSERRRSLPARTSLASIASEFNDYALNNRGSLISITTPKPEVTDFQLRRRRAAKLTQFFGVNYRELIHDILESIEKGLEDERKRGTLNPDEVEDLLQKLRTLRTKRGQLY